ncbi:hypothetical protein HID58_015602 [Brassica napus]|uniref:ABC transporter domain-containing protein n=1 Tax=Brassica napus TaxID=3708 RepID=A0ABQ8DN22_BRANA|nr:hypothetical protein HID58_015602 [Brassica napus]
MSRERVRAKQKQISSRLVMWNSTENAFSRSSSLKDEVEEEEELRWVALQRLPTYSRIRRGIFRDDIGEHKEIRIGNLEASEQRILLDRLVNSVDHDPQLFFARVRKRFDAVDLKFPKIEVRFQNLMVESFVHVGSRALPTIPNFIINMAEAFLRNIRLYGGERSKLTILDNVSGIIRPSRLTLLLGPPSSGKTTLLLSLAGRLGNSLQTSGKITYNGYNLKEIVAPRTSAYVSQQDWHVAEMTVRQNLEFAGRCQGVGFKYDMLVELARREKLAGIVPDEDLDIFMKSLALGGQETSLVVEYIMKFLLQTLSEILKHPTKILGLDTCADTLVGDEMIKGISGGQKKRLTTGELLVGPARVLFMDEISNGLDSSTTHQIIMYMRHSTHALEGTTVISLLQPSPETYELFDDVILMSEGQIIYQGPRDEVLDFFSSLGFSCPERKNVADFLQEVTSKKDQQQYWSVPFRPYRYVPPGKFAEAFRSFPTGKKLAKKLDVPFDKRFNHSAALSTSQYGVKRRDLLKINFSWQKQLMKQNAFIYVFKFVQLLLVALITMTVFCRTTMHHNTIDDGNIYLGSLYFSMVIILFNGFTEVPMLVAKLPVLYKHRDLHFYPSWAYTLPSWLLSVPTSIIESATWVAVTYYTIGYDPHFSRFLQQFLLYFLLHQMSLSLFRVMGSLGRHMIVANTFGSFAMLVVMTLGGFIISRDSIPTWWIWGYWISPLMYAQNAASVNEFLSPSWQKVEENRAGNHTTDSLGVALLRERSLFTENYWYWIGVGALLGYTILFNLLFTVFLAYLNPLGKLQAVVSREELDDRDRKRKGDEFVVELREYLQHSGSIHGKYFKNRGMVLPFQPLSLSFSNINYYVDVPLGLKEQGIQEDRLQLLVNITGAFKPGVLTALVGVSGAGKTTLMDVLAGRKTGGTIEGDVYISGFPKRQETFARISGYCEQNDVHSPCLTVFESLLFSACLRLPSDIDSETQKAFVHEVMELVELTSLSGALVGLPGVDGLSTEQRKRLTIAVELVANPSIVFMDEPTSGLDARAAAIVMRTVRNIVNTGRTIVCTIHQPSIDIFESFDELLFMKRGGELIYAGVKKIKAGHNPAAWMLDVTSSTEEERLGLDFAEIYRNSNLCRRNKELVEGLSKPSNISKELEFPTRYSQSFYSQFVACLWKQNLSYWRNPQYTAVRFFYTVVISLMLGTICWKFGSKRDTQQELFNSMGSMYAAVLFIGITNATAAQPVVSIERFVFIEFPYVLAQSTIYSSIFYAMASFEWSAVKFLWYLFFMYFSIMYFTFYGMMTTAITPNHNVASIIAAPFYMLWNLFSGFMIPYKRIPLWWRWYYWANPVAWTLYGLLVSQYGDDEREVKLSDGVHKVMVKQLLEEVMGYKHDFLGVSAIMVVAFCVFFSVVFAFSIKTFNFQRR